MASHEIYLGFVWMTNKLAGDSQLLASAPGGVVQGLATPSTAHPFVVLIFQSGSDDVIFGGRACSELIFQAKVVGPQTSMTAIVAAADRVETLLNVPAGDTIPGGGHILSSYRMMPLEHDEPVAGEVFSNLGGFQRLYVTRT